MIVAEGTPESVAKVPESHTGQFLAKLLELEAPKPTEVEGGPGEGESRGGRHPSPRPRRPRNRAPQGRDQGSRPLRPALTVEGRPLDESTDPWEQHAQWWQDEFTDGVDAEYEEQILPIVEGYLAGFGRVLDVGTGEGQVARRVAAGGAASVIGLDPTVGQLAGHGRPRWGVTLRPGRRRAAPGRDGAFDAVVACLVFEHLTRPRSAAP